ncbi:MAG TPA: DUF115 domain-containing protein [bacterium]|nr:DUF115 domain-containing protein [bacterium]
MPVMLTGNDVYRQSKQVWNQFGESKWIPFSKSNLQKQHKDSEGLKNIGVGKWLVLAATGESLEEAIPHLKKYRDRIDILTCDKGFGMLLEKGIKADFVMVCDCNILFKWVKPYIGETRGVKLISTLYANPDWINAWLGDRYFYVNKDAIMSEQIFKEIAGDTLRIIPASSNVSNAMLVFFIGSDDKIKTNFAGYEKYLLTGYDYSWKPKGNYYSFTDPKPKRYYMNHRTMLDYKRDVCFTSENLFFSAKWLYSYITVHGLPVVNCSERGLLDIPLKSTIENELKQAPTKEQTKNISGNYEVTQKTYEAFMAAKTHFDNSREVIQNGRW